MHVLYSLSLWQAKSNVCFQSIPLTMRFLFSDRELILIDTLVVHSRAESSATRNLFQLQLYHSHVLIRHTLFAGRCEAGIFG